MGCDAWSHKNWTIHTAYLLWSPPLREPHPAPEPPPKTGPEVGLPFGMDDFGGSPVRDATKVGLRFEFGR